jgi:hypothetical protein
MNVDPVRSEIRATRSHFALRILEIPLRTKGTLVDVAPPQDRNVPGTQQA